MRRLVSRRKQMQWNAPLLLRRSAEDELLIEGFFYSAVYAQESTLLPTPDETATSAVVGPFSGLCLFLYVVGTRSSPDAPRPQLRVSGG